MSTQFPSEIRFTQAERPQETMSGLLVAVAQQAQAIGFTATLVDGLGLRMKVYSYSHANKLDTILASIVVGCRHTAEMQSKLVPDTVAAGLFAMARFPDQAQINAFLRACGPAQVAHLEAAHEQLLRAHSRAGDRSTWLGLSDGTAVLPLDLDQTYLATRSTRATGAARGYFGRKRTAYGYHKSVALLGGGIGEVLWLRLEPGDSHAQDAVAPILATLRALATAQGIRPAEVLVRGDSQYGSTGVLRQVQAAGHRYILKGYTPRTAQHLAASLPATAVWSDRGTDSYGSQLWVIDAGIQELRGHDDPPELAPVRTRVVLLVRVGWRSRRKRGKGAPGTVVDKVVSYEHYLTDLPAERLSAAAVIDLYNGRETEESFFRAEQDAFGAHYLRTHQGAGEAAFLWLLASTINLLRWTQHSSFAATPLEAAGLSKLVSHAMRIPATIIQQAETWVVILPATARLVRALVGAWTQRLAQLPLPLPFADNTT